MRIHQLRYVVSSVIDRIGFLIRMRTRQLVDRTINRGTLRYAQHLVMSTAREHYGDSLSPQFAAFDDVAGCLTQIDNMLTGLARPVFRFSDGREFQLTGVAGGAAPEGEFSTVTCELRQADGSVRVLRYAVQPDES